jgi:tetratricopeptide (TPR) repeat protein
VSRIHDALRRGRAPARASSGGRTASADAVLAALGYRSGNPRGSNTGVVIGLVLFLAVAAGVWWYLPIAIAPKPASVSRKAPTRPEAQAPPQQTAARPPEPKRIEARTAAPKQPEPTPPEATPIDTKPVADRKPAPPPSFVSRVAPAPAPAMPREPAAPATAEQPAADEFRLALYYQRTGDFEQALVHYKTVLQHNEMNADAHTNLGNLYMSKALYEDAAREFRRVIAIEPKYVPAHVNLAAALYQLKHYDESGAEARAAIRLDPRNSDATVNLALAQAAEGQASDARSTLIRALDIDRHNAAAHYNLALQYEKAGEVALALDHYRAFLQYAGPEQAGYAADVRSRVQTLEHK